MRRKLLWQTIRTELAPFDGRLGTAWRVAATCSLVAMLFMTYQIPLVAIGCYLVLFVMKPNPSESMLMAIGICVLVSLVVALLFLLTLISIESPVMRLSVMASSSFLFLFLGAASPLGPVGAIIALVIAFIMTLLGEVPFGEVATRGILYAWLMTLIPMGVLIVFNAAFGRPVVPIVCAQIAGRLHLTADRLLGHDADDLALDSLRQGDDDLKKMLLFIKLFHLLPSAQTRQLQNGISASHMILLAAAALPTQPEAANTAWREALARRCLYLAQDILRAPPPSLASPPAVNWDEPLAALDGMLRIFPTPPPTVKDQSPLARKGFFFPDALTNPAYQHYALKTTLAAVLCYLIYTAINWQDIHTAMITCYVAALGTTAETLHKLVLRIIGCLIGAAMGIGSIFFLIPHMSSIGELMLLVFCGSLCAAWVSTGSERSAYAGVQIGLAFLMTVLQGFGPQVDMAVAMDRIMGILLGNLVLYIVFTRIWPISAASAATDNLRRVLDSLVKRRTATGVLDAAALRADAVNGLATIEQARDQLALIGLEPASLRPSNTRILQLRQLTEHLEQFYFNAAYPDNPSGKGLQQEQEKVLTRLQKELAAT